MVTVVMVRVVKIIIAADIVSSYCIHKMLVLARGSRNENVATWHAVNNDNLARIF